MMTNVTASDSPPWWRFFGPWPLQPLPVALIVGLMSIALGLEPGPWVEQWSVILTGFAVGVLIWAILSAASNWASKPVTRPAGYVALFVLLAVFITALRAFADVIPGTLDIGQRITASITTSTLFLILVQGILGTAAARLKREVSRANEALERLRDQQTAVLRADESVREQVAIVLHDQVQAGLVSACMRLQAVRSDGLSEVERSQAVTEIIHQLEQLRALDLRRAVRSLSPNLQDVDMATALEELAETWAPGMDIDVIVAGTVPKEHDLRLGAYRIVEQALLNAAGHGHANRCRVNLQVGDVLLIHVDDDGSGLPDSPMPGLGSTLITTWCRTLSGSWRWEESPTGGVRLSASLPLSHGG